MFSLGSLLLAASLLVSTLAHAHDYKLGELKIGHPSARPTAAPGQPGGAYMTLENAGKAADKLVAASSPIATSVQIHSMSMDGNIMRMREVANIELPPGAKLAMKPGDGYHLMLLGLKQPLKAGDKFPLILTFEKAGKVEVSVWVEDKAADADAHMHHH